MLHTTRPTRVFLFVFFSLAEYKYSVVASLSRASESIDSRRWWQLIKAGFYFSPLLNPSQNTRAPFRAASTSETPTGWSRRRWAWSTCLQSPTTSTASISRTASTRRLATLVRQVLGRTDSPIDHPDRTKCDSRSVHSRLQLDAGAAGRRGLSVLIQP